MFAASSYGAANTSNAENIECSKCKEKTDRRRHYMFVSAPDVLFLEVHRFDRNSASSGSVTARRRERMTQRKTSDISPYLDGSQGKVLYDRVAEILHRGVSPYAGHYVALARVPDTQPTAPAAHKWLLFDDEKVDPAPTLGEYADGSATYLIAYRKRETDVVDMSSAPPPPPASAQTPPPPPPPPSSSSSAPPPPPPPPPPTPPAKDGAGGTHMAVEGASSSSSSAPSGRAAQAPRARASPPPPSSAPMDQDLPAATKALIAKADEAIASAAEAAALVRALPRRRPAESSKPGDDADGS